jgi:hypothetical protein
MVLKTAESAEDSLIFFDLVKHVTKRRGAAGSETVSGG